MSNKSVDHYVSPAADGERSEGHAQRSAKESRMKSRLVTVCLLAASVASCNSQTQPEQAKLPYAAVYQAVTMQFDEIKSLTNRQARFVMSSKSPDVKPQDITLYIDAKAGRIPLELNSDGTFSLPLRADLMKENPFIVANQPKGTMKLEADITLQVKIDSEGQILAEQHKARYRYLFSVESILDHALEHATKALPEYEAEREETTSWFEFTSTPATNAPALIHSARGNIRVKPDQDGVIRLRYDSNLAKENPWVTFPSDGKWRMETKEKEKAEQPNQPYKK
jgi:hypothetical protein